MQNLQEQLQAQFCQQQQQQQNQQQQQQNQQQTHGGNQGFMGFPGIPADPQQAAAHFGAPNNQNQQQWQLNLGGDQGNAQNNNADWAMMQLLQTQQLQPGQAQIPVQQLQQPQAHLQQQAPAFQHQLNQLQQQQQQPVQQQQPTFVVQQQPPPLIQAPPANGQPQQQQPPQQLHQQLQINQQLQQQVQQIMQQNAVAVPPPMGDPTNNNTPEMDAVAAATAFVVQQQLQGQKQQRHIMTGQEEEGDDDDDDEEDDDDLPPPPPRKRTKTTNNTNDPDGHMGDVLGEEGDDDDDEPTEPKKLSRRQRPPKTNITRTRYSNDFKMRVVSELEENTYGTITDISKHYGVAEQTLRDWMKNKEKIVDAVQRRGSMKANPVNHLRHVTQALLAFMDSHYAQTDQPITARMIAAKGNEIKHQLLEEDARQPFLTDGERRMTNKFSASLSWGKKWVRQYARCKTTQVPQDLEELSKEELVRLLRSVASEREQQHLGQNVLMPGEPKAPGDPPANNNNALAMPGGMGGGNTTGGGGVDLNALLNGTPPKPIYVKASTLLPLIPAPPRVKVNTTYKVDQAKSRICETLTALIKKKPHNWKGRPTTEMTEEVPTLEAARELMKGYPEVNKTARSYRWQLTGAQVIEWLGCPKYVHPVNFQGKVVCTIGQTASVYAFAGFDSMLAKYEQGTATLTLKVKTYTAGTGNIPGSDDPVFMCDH
ncbi:expressed unknown protein [Seminavis robusta]|uniref:HTH psq-type domain-containing protein n=1 Tax=Seminavis robusta TaxID=568900 RepID=A0A9N8EFP6_9STRA|nr:expressed unknown protein [Seminavis robusta]|eukprot:Sro1087_g239820.1 n/a (709) ;mRNA; r:12983-15196